MRKLLDSLHSPADLKPLTYEELEGVAQELRQSILSVVSETGGHLSSNLGVVELTLALHRIFNTPQDKILWDVGHQAYSHKLLTGRQELFPKLRQFGGISGFPNRDESAHDTLNTGHASTVLSAAFGLVVSRESRKENHHVVAVVGDGSLTGGLSLEAINQIGQHKKRLIIVLNDNKMSISPNVGAISKYLDYLQSGQFYVKTKESIRTVVEGIPGIGPKFVDLAHDIEDKLKKLMTPGSFFEELGIKYVGPINGHNLRELEGVLKKCKDLTRPVLIHVVTKKGKGYLPAEKKPDLFHSAAPFDIATGRFRRSDHPPTYSTVFGKTVAELGAVEPRLFAITAAMPEGTGLQDFQKAFPARFFDVGIAEQHAAEFAVGLALGGERPLVAIYSTFLQRAYDQLVHDVSLMDLPIVFAIDRAGAVSGDGPTHQGIYDLSYLLPLPNFVVMAPKDEAELRNMLYTSLQWDHPVAIRYPKAPGQGIPLAEGFETVPLGRWETLKEGNNGMILAVGPLVYEALEAARQLEHEGISVGVVNARFVKPLDEKLLFEIGKKARWILTLEDGVLQGGFGSAVASALRDKELFKTQVHSLGYPDSLLPQGSSSQIRKLFFLDREGIANRVRKLHSHKKKTLLDNIKEKIF